MLFLPLGRAKGGEVRRRAADERQVDLFGGTLPAPPAPEPRAAARKAPARKTASGERAPDPEPVPPTAPEVEPAAEPVVEVKRLSPTPDPGVEALASRLSPAELDEFVAALSDDALASLALEAVRQVRRRLVRGSGQRKGAGKGRVSPLERAARQLAAELGGQAGDDGT